MRIVLILATASLAAVAAGCGTDDPSVTAAQRGRPLVVAAFWPLAELAREVAGDAAVVVNMTPTGDSPHEVELTPRQRGEIGDAALAVVLGRRFQPEIEDAAAEREGPTVEVLAELDLPDRSDGRRGPADPHVWLDPTIMGSVATLVADAIAALLPDEAHDVRGRAASIVERYVELDARIEQGLESCRLTIIATHHEAFGWYAARYGLTNVALHGVSPGERTAPDPERLAALSTLVEDGSVATLFTEPLTPGSWLEVVGDEHGLDVRSLNPYEGLTAREDADGLDYEETQLANLRALRENLDCAG